MPKFRRSKKFIKRTKKKNTIKKRIKNNLNQYNVIDQNEGNHFENAEFREGIKKKHEAFIIRQELNRNSRKRMKKLKLHPPASNTNYDDYIKKQEERHAKNAFNNLELKIRDSANMVHSKIYSSNKINKNRNTRIFFIAGHSVMCNRDYNSNLKEPIFIKTSLRGRQFVDIFEKNKLRYLSFQSVGRVSFASFYNVFTNCLISFIYIWTIRISKFFFKNKHTTTVRINMQIVIKVRSLKS